MFKKGFFLGPLFPAAVIGSYSQIFQFPRPWKSFARLLTIVSAALVISELVLTE
jgi:hypothetical protein